MVNGTSKSSSPPHPPSPAPPPPLPSLSGPKRIARTPTRISSTSTTPSTPTPSSSTSSHCVMPPFTPPGTIAAGVETPHNHDVLCGRGVTTNRHKGNEKFRGFVAQNKELYVTSTKKQKMTISRSIVETVRTLDPPGRFLEKDPNTGLWFDIGDKKAVEKTSQALRDGAAGLRKQLSIDTSDSTFLNAVFDENGKPPKGGGKKKHRRTSSMPNSSSNTSSLSSSGGAAASASTKSSAARVKPQPPALKKQRSGTDFSAIVTSASADGAEAVGIHRHTPTLSPRFQTSSPRLTNSPRFSATTNTTPHSHKKKRGHKRAQSASAIPSFHPASPTPNNVNPMHYHCQSPTPSYGHYHHHRWHPHGPPPPPHPTSPQVYPPRQPYLPTSPTYQNTTGQDQLSPLPYSHHNPHMYIQPQHSWSGPAPSGPPPMPSAQHSSSYGQHPPLLQQSYSQGAYPPPPPPSAAPPPNQRLMPTPSPIHISPTNQSTSQPHAQHHTQHFFPSPGGTLSRPPPPTSSHIPPSPSSHTLSPPQLTAAPPTPVLSEQPPPQIPVPSLQPSYSTPSPPLQPSHRTPTHSNTHHHPRPPPPQLPSAEDLLETSFSQSSISNPLETSTFTNPLETSICSNPNLISEQPPRDEESFEQDVFMKLDKNSPPRKNPKVEQIGSFEEFPSPLPYDPPASPCLSASSPSLKPRPESPTLLYGSLSEHILSLPLDSPPQSPVRKSGGDIWRSSGNTAVTGGRRREGRSQEHVRQVSDPPLPPFENAS